MSPVPAGRTLTHVSGAAEFKGLPSSRSQPGTRDRCRFRFPRMRLTQDQDLDSGCGRKDGEFSDKWMTPARHARAGQTRGNRRPTAVPNRRRLRGPKPSPAGAGPAPKFRAERERSR